MLTASMTNSQGYAATMNNLSANFVDFGGPRYLLALLPDSAVAASYVTDDGQDISLSILQDAGACRSSRAVGCSTVTRGQGDWSHSTAQAWSSRGSPLGGADQPGLTSLPPPATTSPLVTTAPAPAPTTATTCGSIPGSPSDLAVEPAQWLDYGEYQRWTDVEGCPIRVDVISQTQGPDHCDWQSVTFLSIGDPIGEPFETAADMRRFVWDPDEVLPRVDNISRHDVVPSSQLPPAAADTGYRVLARPSSGWIQRTRSCTG